MPAGGGPSDTTAAVGFPILSLYLPAPYLPLTLLSTSNIGIVYAATQTTRRERIQTRHKRIRNKVRNLKEFLRSNKN